MFRLGQGCTCGPPFWNLLYKLIADSIDPTYQALQFYSVCRSVAIAIAIAIFGSSFVNDTGLGATSDYTDLPTLSQQENSLATLKHTVTKLQNLAQHWEKHLFTTGGAIDLGKSHWYALYWKWKNSLATLLTDPPHPPLQLTSGYNAHPEPIPYLSPNSSFRTLGVFLSPSGSPKRQFDVLCHHVSLYSSHFRSSMLTREETHWSYMLYLRPRLLYPLSCTYLSPSQCKSIQSKALEELLPKLHFNRHMAWAILFRGFKYGGINLYVDQGYQQITLLIGHINKGDDISQQILILISNVQLYLMISRKFFILPFKTNESWALHSCITSIWQFTSSLKVTVDVKKHWCPPLPRQHDAMLMDLAISNHLSIPVIKS